MVFCTNPIAHVVQNCHFKFRAQSLCRGVLLLLICSVCWFLSYSLQRYCCAKLNAHFLSSFAPIILAKCVQFNVLAGKCTFVLISRYSDISVTDGIGIGRRNRSMATGPLFVHFKVEAIWMLLPDDMEVLNHKGYQYS